MFERHEHRGIGSLHYGVRRRRPATLYLLEEKNSQSSYTRIVCFCIIA